MSVVPVIINKLSVSEFGLISLLNSLLSYLAVATIAITSSLGRNLIFSREKGEGESSKELSTVIVAIVVLGALLLPILYIYSKDILMLMGIDSLYLDESTKILKTMFFLFFINAVSNAIGATFFFKNRLDILSVSSFITQVSTHFFFLILLIFSSIGLMSYIIAMTLTTSILFFYTYIMYKKHSPEINVKIKLFSLSKVKSTLGMSSWLIINQVGVLIIFQCGILIVNQYEGLESVGYLAVGLIIATQIRVTSTLISSLFEPTLMKCVAENDIIKSNRIFKKIVLVISMIVGFICGIYIGSADYVLTLWLGSYDPMIKKISIFSIVYLPLILGFSSAWPLLMAHNKVKIGAVITLITGVLHVFISLILYNLLSIGVYSVLLSTIIVMVFKNNILTPLLLQSLGINVTKALIYGLCGLIYMIITAFITKAIFSLINEVDLFIVLFFLSASSLLALTFPVILLMLNSSIPISKFFKSPKQSILTIIKEISK
ncbi:hypothetical protein AB6D70_20280 [Vibrio splendidus]